MVPDGQKVWTDRRMDEWTEGRTDGQMDGHMDRRRQIFIPPTSSGNNMTYFAHKSSHTEPVELCQPGV